VEELAANAFVVAKFTAKRLQQRRDFNSEESFSGVNEI
jgi:hypothetical protein